jgi:hypothetical protein
MRKKIELILCLLTAILIVASCQIPQRNLENSPSAPFVLNAKAEDYTSDIIMRFGDTLRDAIYSSGAHNTPWRIKNVLRGNYNAYQHHWMNYAWNRWHDEEFMVMMKAENGMLNHDRQSLVRDKNGREPSFGFCQIHKGYHPEIVNDPRFFTDPAWQLEQCKRLWDGGTKFYGYINKVQREKARKHFDFK